MKHKIYVFYLKCVLIPLPFIALLIFYIMSDPFMVIRKYTDYDAPEVALSEGVISWNKYKANEKSMHFDSFIMGTSCTKAFHIKEWSKYTGGKGFRMFSNNEGAGDLLLKMQALDSEKGQKIKNVLIVADKQFFEENHPQPGIMPAMPPEVTGQSEIKYQMDYFQGFCTPMFLIPYLRYRIFHEYDDKTMNGIINNDGRIRNSITNDAVLCQDDAIKKNGEKYWENQSWPKEHHTAFTYAPIIKTESISCLIQIRSICQRHGTNVKIAIGPTFNAKQMNPKDIATLKKIFGDKNVVDFSDNIHSKFRNYHYFYDKAHYRDVVGNAIMKELYAEK